MALFDKLRAELVDIVEWIDDSQHTLVWRFPRYRNQIKYCRWIFNSFIVIDTGIIAALNDLFTFSQSEK